MSPTWWHKWDASMKTQGKMGTPRGRNFPALKVLWGIARLRKREYQGKRRLPSLKFSSLLLLAPNTQVCLWNPLTFACQTCSISWPSYQPAGTFIKGQREDPSIRRPTHIAVPCCLFSGMFCPERCSCLLPL